MEITAKAECVAIWLLGANNLIQSIYEKRYIDEWINAKKKIVFTILVGLGW